MHVLWIGDQFPEPGAQGIDTQHHQTHGKQTGESGFETNELCEFQFFHARMSPWKKVVEQHQGSPQDQCRKHVWEEGRLPWPIGGGVQVFEHGSDFNQRHNFHLLSKRSGK